MLLTAKNQESDKILGLEMGADDYITKPYSSRELRARIKAVLRRSVPQHLETFSFGNILVAFGRFEVTRHGERVDFTVLEFKLLTAFIHSQGRVLTRERLVDQIWGVDRYATDRVIDNHIVNLRKKIEPNPAEPQHLMSVRGIG